MLNLQAASLGDYQHRTRPPDWRPTSIEWAPHAMGASSLPHWLYCKPALKTSAKKTYDHPACPPRNGLTSSPHQRFVASDPLQGQQLLVCVHVMTAENSGVSTWMSRTFDIPHAYKIFVSLKRKKKKRNWSSYSFSHLFFVNLRKNTTVSQIPHFYLRVTYPGTFNGVYLFFLCRWQGTMTISTPSRQFWNRA
jgi:hypothetical protein